MKETKSLTDPFQGTDYQDYAVFFGLFGIEMKDESGNLKTPWQVFQEAAGAARRGGDAE